jgi:hypothetical protein
MKRIVPALKFAGWTALGLPPVIAAGWGAYDFPHQVAPSWNVYEWLVGVAAGIIMYGLAAVLAELAVIFVLMLALWVVTGGVEQLDRAGVAAVSAIFAKFNRQPAAPPPVASYGNAAPQGVEHVRERRPPA